MAVGDVVVRVHLFVAVLGYRPRPRSPNQMLYAALRDVELNGIEPSAS